MTDVSVDMDGTGISTSPFGRTRLRMVTFEGTGISTSPFGFLTGGRSLRLTAIDGTGISTSPFGFHARHMFLTRDAVGGTGISTSPFGHLSNPIFLSRGLILGSGDAATPLTDRLDDGGWATDAGYGGASVLVATGILDGCERVDGDELGGSSVGSESTPFETEGLPAYYTMHLE